MGLTSSKTRRIFYNKVKELVQMNMELCSRKESFVLQVYHMTYITSQFTFDISL